jgi:hypothetical protein
VDTRTFTVEHHSKVQIDTGKPVGLNENPEHGYRCIKRPPCYLSPTESMRSQPRHVDAAIEIESSCEAPIANVG